MSYTAPSASSVNFQFQAEGYTAPSASAVDFAWIPTTTISGSSTTAFFGAGVLSADFSLFGSSDAVFYNPYREFAIQSGSLFEPQTWLRTFTFESKSELSIRAGSIATATSSSSVALQVHGIVQAAASVATSSSTDMRAMWIHNVTATVKAKTLNSFAGAYNKDFGIFVSSRSTFAPVPRLTSSTVFSSEPQSTAAFAARRLLLSDFSIASASAMLGEFRVQSPAGFSVSTATDAGFSGQQAMVGGFASSAYSDAAFVGSYQYTTPVELPEPDAVFYVTAPRREIVAVS